MSFNLRNIISARFHSREVILSFIFLFGNYFLSKTYNRMLPTKFHTLRIISLCCVYQPRENFFFFLNVAPLITTQLRLTTEVNCVVTVVTSEVIAL